MGGATITRSLPEETTPKYLILDQDQKFGSDVTETLKSMEIRIKRTAYRSPWQNGVAEHWVGSCRRDLLDHMMVFNEAHLRRWVQYIRYYRSEERRVGKECRL